MTPSALICGAGPAGMALATLLHRDEWQVSVVERSPWIRAGGYAVDLRDDGLHAAAELGLLKDLRATQTAMTGTTLIDVTGACVGSLPAEEFSGQLEVPKAVLTGLLYSRTCENVEYIFGDTVSQLEQRDEQVEVSLQNGGTRSVDLLVGADGLWSRTRRLGVTDDPNVVHHLGLSGSGFTTENFLGLDHHAVLRMGTGVAVYAFSAAERSRMTVSLTFANATVELDHASRADQEAAIRHSFAGDGWVLPELLGSMTRAEDFYFASACQVHLPRWSSGRLVLLGDAACCAAPTSGMGTTQAIVGACILADALREFPLPDALAVYEQRLRPDVAHNQRTGIEGARRFGAARAIA